MTVKKLLVELLEKLNSGEYSQIILDETLKKPEISEGEKGLITEIFYGTIRNKILLEYIIETYAKKPVKKTWLKHNLMIALYQLLFMSSKENKVVWEATELSKKRYGDVIGKFTNGLLRNVEKDKAHLLENLEKTGQFQIRYSYPDWVYGKIKKQYPDNYVEILKFLKHIPVMSYRVNQLKLDKAVFKKYIQENQFKIQKQVDEVYYIKNRKLIHNDFLAYGDVVIQDASSYLCAKLLSPNPGETVLDACAAPGGKTAVLAELMENSGHIDALELHLDRAEGLKFFLMKYGVTNTAVHHLDALSVETLEKKYDKILLDVPCSGLGVLRKKTEIVYNRTPEDIVKLAKIQYDILETCARTLKIGGELVYSTCTLLKEENQNVVMKFLENHANFSVKESKLPGIITQNDGIGGHIISVENGYFDTFYMIKLTRVSE